MVTIGLEITEFTVDVQGDVTVTFEEVIQFTVAVVTIVGAHTVVLLFALIVPVVETSVVAVLLRSLLANKLLISVEVLVVEVEETAALVEPLFN